MNRKGVREQNDISIIIGNLPKRLQKKIADEVGEKFDVGTSNSNINSHNCGNCETSAASTRATTITTGNDSGNTEVNDKQQVERTIQYDNSVYVEACGSNNVPSIDFFLKMGAKSNSQTVSKVVEQEKENEGAKIDVTKCEETHVDDSATIPGIIRLKITEAAKVKPKENNKATVTTSSRENGRRHQVASRVSRAELPHSPAHQILQKTFPNQPDWFESVEGSYAQDLTQCHDKLLIIMQKKAVVEKWTAFCAIRKQLQHIFVELLLHHLKFCCEQKVDNFFWKLLYYNVREYLKQQKPTQAVAVCILALLDDGLQFYAHLYAQLNEKYMFKAVKETTEMPPPMNTSNGHYSRRSTHKFEFIAKVAAQKLLICLGDLSRYKAKQLETNDYTETTKYYQQAQLLIPTNGIPYNQLAIAAILDRKKFDAVYYHMRSLMSSNAIYSAKESLLVVFDEIRKKYEETELKTSPVHQMANKNNKNSSKSMRKEVWVYPDGVRRLHRTNMQGNKMSFSDENRLNALTNDDLLRRFISLYLYVIGKLYTGIGMESIQEHQRKLLVQFNCALKRTPLILTRTRVLKIVALNIFVLQQNLQNDTSREMRYHAFNFCNEFFGLILRKCNQLFGAYLEDTDACAEQDFADLNTLLQFIKVYVEFLTLNVHIWEPNRNEENAFTDCWAELRRLFPLLQRSSIQNSTKEFQKPASIVLEEEIFCAGFTPLPTANKNKCHVDASSESAQFQARVTKIAQFQQCIEEHSKSVELPEDTHFVLEQWNAAFKHALDHLQHVEENSENIVTNGVQKDPTALELKLAQDTNAEDAQISQLSKLKKELEAQSNVKKKYNAKLEEILKFVDTKVYLEVRPKYLLPDTNCFIDCLEDFERLAKEFKRYTLIIPLTVVKELDGLSKGVKLESYEKSLQKHRIHHFDDVSTRAKKSLDFIKTTKNNVKCATTKGSIINASLFALVEEENVSNDDKILATSLALSKTLSTETCKDGKCFIQTELVLITTDRNLRVKALSRNLAVSELCEFLQWAKDCSDL